MPWTWVRPADENVLVGRPLLDLGTGDGQTLAALGVGGFVVGIDRSEPVLPGARRAADVRVVCGAAGRLPFGDGTFGCVLAGDLLHHLDDEALSDVLIETRRVLRADAAIVAWWYERPARGGPDAPAHPRPFEFVAAAAEQGGFRDIEPLELRFSLEPAPATVGMRALR